MNKKLLIGVGVIAFAGVAFCMWKNKQGKNSESNSSATGKMSPEDDLVESNQDYRVQKEIESINYYPVNKGFYYND